VQSPQDFLEGYGKLSDFGITWKVEPRVAENL
jgi:hypothetical protein